MNKLDLDYLFTLIDLKAVVASKVHLQNRGANWWGLCPFHNDSKPSMSVNLQKGIFKCFSCGVSGNAVSFLQKLHNITFFSALKEALTLSGVKQDVLDTLKQNFKITKNQKILMLNKYAMQLMHDYLLMSWNNPEVNAFLKHRNLDLKIVETFNLGFLNTNYEEEFFQSLLKFCQENFSDEVADDLVLKSGLFFVNNETKKTQLFFRNRLIFPILDKNTEVMGFSGREITKTNAKYLNSSESSYFKKSQVLYNFYSLNALENVKQIILVEGYLDCLRLVQNNYLFTVATMGVALTSEQQNLIFSLNKLQKIILSFDNDEAGKNAFLHNLKLLLDYEVMHHLNIPIYLSGLASSNYKDPDELFCHLKTKEAKQIFDQNKNGLLAAALCILDENNLEFSLNQALSLILPYADNLVLFANEALEALKNHILSNYSVTEETWNLLISNAQKNKLRMTVKQSSNFVVNFGEKTPKLSVKKQRQSLIIDYLVKYIHLLYTNYVALIALLFYYPQQVKQIIVQENNENFHDSLTLNDQKFRQIVKTIKQNGLKNVLGEVYSFVWNQFCFFGFVPYLYLDYLDLQNYEAKKFSFNKKIFLNDSKFLAALKSDETWEHATFFLSDLNTLTWNDAKKSIEIFNNKQELANKVLKLLKNVYRLLETIGSLLLRFSR